MTWVSFVKQHPPVECQYLEAEKLVKSITQTWLTVCHPFVGIFFSHIRTTSTKTSRNIFFPRGAISDGGIDIRVRNKTFVPPFSVVLPIILVHGTSERQTSTF